MKTKGYTLIEVLFAGLILAVTVTGAITAWQTTSSTIMHAAREHVAVELARANIEKAMALGFKYLATDANGKPLGTYNAGTGIGTYVFPVEYYDQYGQPVTTGQPYFSLQRTVYDYNVDPAATGTGYALDPHLTVRRVYVQVNRLPDNGQVWSMGTNLVRGGL